jgi:hypothetical protein
MRYRNNIIHVLLSGSYREGKGNFHFHGIFRFPQHVFTYWFRGLSMLGFEAVLKTGGNMTQMYDYVLKSCEKLMQ